MAILVTGGAGYIGSHTVRKLLEKGYKVVIIDNLSRGNEASIPSEAVFVNCDISDEKKVSEAIKKYKIDSVIHFAAFAYVGESVENPELYYNNNLTKGIAFLEILRKNNVNRIIFSSSCATYGTPQKVPISEKDVQNPINPYGLTKLLFEKVLISYSSMFNFKFIALRYFNVAGAGYKIGENHNPETHVIPLILDVALGKMDSFKIFGNDYPTPDGTCLRDYIHVIDLAEAHVLALEKLDIIKMGFYNLGTGKGTSVKELVDTCSKVTGCEIPVKYYPRREGDPASLISNPKKAKKELGWKAKYDLKDMVKSAWDWHNKEGF